MTNSLPLARVNSVYSCIRTLILDTHFVSFPPLARFSAELHAFSKMVGEAHDDPYWSSFIRPLKRYRFDLCASPWSAESLKDYTLDRYNEATKHIEGCHQIFPSLATPAKLLTEKLIDIFEEGYDPIIDGLHAIATSLQSNDSQRSDTAILIKESRLVPIARHAISNAPDFAHWPVLVPHNVRDLSTYHQMVVVGPPYWYPEFVFTAPRATSIDVLCYDFMSVHWKPESAFVAPIKGSYRARQIKIAHSLPMSISSTEDILPPSADIDRVMDRARKESDRKSEDEVVIARLLDLEGEMGVFIEAEGEAKVLVIDLNEEAKNRVKRISHQLLEPEMYILLRTSGGGDYVVPVADRLLGSQADILREMQQTWKARLRIAVKQNGMDKTINSLKVLGSKIATHQNIRNWMSDRTIVTADPGEFAAIMRFIGLQKEIETYWQAMRRIRGSHIRAGRRIKQRLVQQVNKSDLAELERVGFMEFTLGEQDAGSLTAYRIRSTAPQTVGVLPSRIDNAFRMEDT